MVVIKNSNNEEFRVQGGTIMFGRTAAGVLVPMLVATDGSLAVSGAGGVAASVTIADGQDIALGALGDAAVVNPASPASVIALLKGQLTELLALLNNTSTAQTPSWKKYAVDGTVAAGAKAITIMANEKFTGTVDGTEFVADSAMTWRAELGHKLAAIDYTVAEGAIYVGLVV